MFQHIDAYAGDPILSLMEEFSKDPRQNKVNLSIGLYYNEDNIVPQLQSVQKAYTHLMKLIIHKNQFLKQSTKWYSVSSFSMWVH